MQANPGGNPSSTAADGGSRCQQATPPLVFTTQFTGSPRVQESSPTLEPLRVSNFFANSDPSDGSLNSPVVPHHHSNAQLHVRDSPIRVTCRTRGGRKSPVLTHPMAGGVLVEPDATRGSPYGYSLSRRSSPIQLSSPVEAPNARSFSMIDAIRDNETSAFSDDRRCNTGVSGQGSDSAALMGPGNAANHHFPLQTPTALPASVVHRALCGHCRFVEFPTASSSANAAAHNSVGSSTNDNSISNASSTGDPQHRKAVFIGQVRFETTQKELIWLVHRLSGACASHLESRGAGCYLLYCKSEADLQLVRSLHKRVLFDIGGVWFARTAEEIDALCEYVALEAPLLSRNAHLPRDSMVVEELRTDAVSHHTPGTRFGYDGGSGGGGPYRGVNMGPSPFPPPPHPLQQPFLSMYTAVAPYGVSPYPGVYDPPPYEASTSVTGPTGAPQQVVAPSSSPPPPYGQ